MAEVAVGAPGDHQDTSRKTSIVTNITISSHSRLSNGALRAKLISDDIWFGLKWQQWWHLKWRLWCYRCFSNLQALNVSGYAICIKFETSAFWPHARTFNPISKSYLRMEKGQDYPFHNSNTPSVTDWIHKFPLHTPAKRPNCTEHEKYTWNVCRTML